MNKFVKIAAVAAVALASTPALAAPVGVTGPAPQASARIVKPLTLSATGAVDLGTIVLNVTPTANRVIALDDTNSLDCASSSAEVSCSGSTSVATYHVTGTNNQTVYIYKNATNLTNANDGSTLPFTPLGAASVSLGNSGAAGVDFTIGGSITITPTTTDGLYSGAIDVKVDYN